ncbi:MAG TPA: hypothetical protein VFI31_29840 [Pirellulales bacterium]|nr:hypothetical protein [Pirellulales bacterium]
MLFTAVCALIYVHCHPARCYARAADLIGATNNPHRFEELNYAWLKVRHSARFAAHASLLRAKLLIVSGEFAPALEELLVADAE